MCASRKPGTVPSFGDVRPSYRIALYHWTSDGSIGENIAHELEQLGHDVRSCLDTETIQPDLDIVFTYAPYGRWFQLPRQLSRMPVGERPFLVHWNTEGLPPPHVPPALQRVVSLARSRFDEGIQRRTRSSSSLARGLDSFSQARMLRYRYLGDYIRVQQFGIPFLVADISALYTRRLADLGLDCINVPFGTAGDWYADLNLDRDIDVLWIGSHGSWRRSRELQRIGAALSRRNIRLHRIDGREAPFVHGAGRTVVLNRTKIVLNVMRTPYDDNTLRHFIAMPNRALVVSEPMLRHNTRLLPGLHYVEAALSDLPDTIAYYLENDAEREAIVDRAYQLTTGELAMRRMIQRILDAVSERLPRLP